MGGYNSSTSSSKEKTKISIIKPTNKPIGSQSFQETVKSIPETIWSYATSKKKFHGTREDIFKAYLLLSHSNYGIPMDVVRYIIYFALKDGQWFEYDHDFDKNGILYYLGTNEGKDSSYSFPKNYVQVSPTKIFQGTIQQAFSWYGSAPPVVQNWCYKGWANNQTEVHGHLWFSIQFLQHSVVPVKYTIRHGYPGGHALRNWNFEASNDGHKWKILEKYKDNKSINGRDLGCTASFDISPENRDSYQYFRIYVTGETEQNSYYLMMCGFEIYGFLRNE